jgi:hypothetical protein
MSSESLCQVACSWVDVCRFHTCLVVKFMIFTVSVKNILDNTCITEKNYSNICIIIVIFSTENLKLLSGHGPDGLRWHGSPPSCK